MNALTTRAACLTAALVLLAHVGPVAAQPVLVGFTATVQTVSGTPFGFDSSIRLAPANGFFLYDTRTADSNPSDTQRGDYRHTAAAPGAFRITVNNLTVSGSQTPDVQIENFTGADTFRFIDGPRAVGPQGGIMSANGTPNSNIQLGIAMTDSSGNAFSSDALPSTFPFAQPPLNSNLPNSFPHTFSLSDANGTLLFQLNSLTQGVPEPSSFLLVLLGPAFVAVGRRARRKARPDQAPA